MLVVAMIGLCLGEIPLQAQDEAAKTNPAKVQPVQPYRLDFSFNEVEDGKIANTRHYSMDLAGEEPNEVKIGTRVPVTSGEPQQYQYIDVGTQIWSQMRAHGNEQTLVVRSEISNLDLSAAGDRGQGDRRPFLPPVVRQIKISGETLLVVGKQIAIGSVDDPNSKRQFQLEVMVTKLK